MKFLGLGMPEIAISLMPMLLCAAGVVGIVMGLIFLFHMTRSLDQIAAAQKEQTDIVRSLVAANPITIGNSNEQR